MTDNIEINNYVKKHKRLLKARNATFLGVFSSDHLPKVNSHNACMIVNYSASDKSNEGHWCTILSLNNPGKNAYWFDSYGKFPDEDDTVLHDQTNFKDYIQKNSSTGKYDYNHVDWQSYTGNYSDVCGEFSLLCVLYGPPEDNASVWRKLKNIRNPNRRGEFVEKFIGIRK